jgi:nitrite reductase (NO-forming)
MKTIGILVLLTCSVFIFSAFQNTQPAFDLKTSIVRGKTIYEGNCMSCHMEHGEGLEGVFPPLAKADYLMADKNRAIIQVIKGASGDMKVNGKIYNGDMAPSGLNDKDVSDVLNYIRNSFGNKGTAIKPDYVKSVRLKIKK